MISQETAKVMLTPGERAASDPVVFGSDFMTPICTAFYGVRPNDILPETMIAVIMWLQDKNITRADIQTAYKEAIIEKKPYLLLSRDEILAPIREYWRKKSALLNEIKSLDKEQRTEEEEKARKSKEMKDAFDLFVQSWNNKEWTGTEFQAKAIRNLEKFSAIDRRVCKLFWKHAKRERHKHRKEMNAIGLYVDTIAPGEEFIFAQKWATYICKNQIPIELFEYENHG